MKTQSYSAKQLRCISEALNEGVPESTKNKKPWLQPLSRLLLRPPSICYANRMREIGSRSINDFHGALVTMVALMTANVQALSQSDERRAAAQASKKAKKTRRAAAQKPKTSVAEALFPHPPHQDAITASTSCQTDNIALRVSTVLLLHSGKI